LRRPVEPAAGEIRESPDYRGIAQPTSRVFTLIDIELDADPT
jgi:hypothetical protein